MWFSPEVLACVPARGRLQPPPPTGPLPPLPRPRPWQIAEHNEALATKHNTAACGALKRPNTRPSGLGSNVWNVRPGVVIVCLAALANSRAPSSFCISEASALFSRLSLCSVGCQRSQRGRQALNVHLSKFRILLLGKREWKNNLAIGLRGLRSMAFLTSPC